MFTIEFDTYCHMEVMYVFTPISSVLFMVFKIL